MLTLLTSLLISLAILAIIYVLIKWILSFVTIPAPLITILDIVVGIIAVVIVLRFLITLT